MCLIVPYKKIEDKINCIMKTERLIVWNKHMQSSLMNFIILELLYLFVTIWILIQYFSKSNDSNDMLFKWFKLYVWTTCM
jgi:hypothetical protein